jgi:O-antigen/teichoic acid export membrane protein
MMLTKAISFIMLPIYTRLLTPADYGVMELISLTLDIISIVAGAKLAVGIFRYYYKAESPAEKNAVISTAFIGLGISYGVVGAATFLAAGPLATLVFGSPEHVELIRIASLTLALQSLIIVPTAYARMQDQSLLFVGANVVKLLIGLSLNILFLIHMGMGVKGVFLANLIATAVVGAGLGFHVVRSVGLSFSRAATRDLLRYGVPLIAMQCAAFILTFGDRYFLQATTDETTVGLYSLAYTFGFLLATIGYIPFEMVWEPARFRIAGRDDYLVIMNRAFHYMSIFLISMAVGFAIFVKDLLRVMAAPEFLPAADLVPLILVAFIFQGWTTLHDLGIHMKEKTEYLTLANWIAAGVALAGYAILIPRYQGQGAATATVIAFAVRYFIVYRTAQSLWYVPYDWRPVVKLCALAVTTAVISLSLRHSATLWFSLASGIGIFIAYVALLWQGGVLSREDRALIREASASPRTVLASLRGS